MVLSYRLAKATCSAYHTCDQCDAARVTECTTNLAELHKLTYLQTPIHTAVNMADMAAPSINKCPSNTPLMPAAPAAYFTTHGQVVLLLTKLQNCLSGPV